MESNEQSGMEFPQKGLPKRLCFLRENAVRHRRVPKPISKKQSGTEIQPNGFANTVLNCEQITQLTREGGRAQGLWQGGAIRVRSDPRGPEAAVATIQRSCGTVDGVR